MSLPKLRISIVYDAPLTNESRIAIYNYITNSKFLDLIPDENYSVDLEICSKKLKEATHES